VNVDLIYKQHREEAFALQFADTKYRTFVAMPFGTTGGYPAQRIHKLLASVTNTQTENYRLIQSGILRSFAVWTKLHRARWSLQMK
jgi:hypothetical protein